MGIQLRSDLVSERSLELNVLSEAVNDLRRVYVKAYLVGYTARQEANHGLDVSIDAPGRVLAAFQFKAPKKRAGDTYVFVIGERCWTCGNPNVRRRRLIAEVLKELNIEQGCINQHMLLYIVAYALKLKIGLDVYYALPLVWTYSELERYVPHLLQRTVVIPVLSLPTTLLDCRRHRILVEVLGGSARSATVLVQSEPVKLPRGSYMLLDELLKKLELEGEKGLPEAKQTIHISIEELEAALRQILPEREGRRLAEALAQVSFTYRGMALAVGRGRGGAVGQSA